MWCRLCRWGFFENLRLAQAARAARWCAAGALRTRTVQLRVWWVWREMAFGPPALVDSSTSSEDRAPLGWGSDSGTGSDSSEEVGPRDLEELFGAVARGVGGGGGGGGGGRGSEVLSGGPRAEDGCCCGGGSDDCGDEADDEGGERVGSQGSREKWVGGVCQPRRVAEGEDSAAWGITRVALAEEGRPGSEALVIPCQRASPEEACAGVEDCGAAVRACCRCVYAAVASSFREAGVVKADEGLGMRPVFEVGARAAAAGEDSTEAMLWQLQKNVQIWCAQHPERCPSSLMQEEGAQGLQLSPLGTSTGTPAARSVSVAVQVEHAPAVEEKGRGRSTGKRAGDGGEGCGSIGLLAVRLICLFVACVPASSDGVCRSRLAGLCAWRRRVESFCR